MTQILIAVFDGLQPAQIRPDLAPNLARFAQQRHSLSGASPQMSSW